MFRPLLFFSLIPLIIGLIVRWWFGVRVLGNDGARPCRCDLNRWLPVPDDASIVHRAEESAAEFGRQVRLKALADWHDQEPKAAASREKTRRFGLAVPPFTGIVAVFAVLVGKIPVLGAIIILIAATAVATVFNLLSLPAELTAITRSSRRIRDEKNFPNIDDEEAVMHCAIAHAWDAALPPILRWIHR